MPPSLHRAAAALAFALAVGCCTGASDAQDVGVSTSEHAPVAGRDSPPYEISIDRHMVVHADRTSLTTTTVRSHILQDAGIPALGQQTLSYIEGMQSLDILEAYTEKTDGRRVDVDPATVITRDAASGMQAVYMRDAKVKTIIFPDVQVGDSLVYRIRLDTRERLFPGSFYAQEVLSRSLPFKTVSITLEAPADLKLAVATHGDGITRTEEVSGDTRIQHFSYSARAWTQEIPGSVAVTDREPRIFITSFPDYVAIGAAYWASTADKVAVTPEIQRQADEITAGVTGKLAQARALDQWVKHNVRYVAVYLGQGRVVPNAAASVLKNRYGDCKDQAVLLTALLNAKGIAAEHVLLQLGNSYRLPEVAMPFAFNHAIVYLPDFETFTDPTMSQAAFGVTHEQAADKQVLVVGAKGARLMRIPPLKPEANTTINRTRIKVAADGTISGSTEQIASGYWATAARNFASRVQSVGRERAAENMLTSQGTPGRGAIDPPATAGEASETAVIRSSYTLSEKLALPLQGLRRMPFGLATQSRPGGYLFGQRRAGRTEPFVCLAGRQVEEIDIEFAPGLPMPAKITGGTIENRLFRFTRSYEIEGRVFKVRRELVSRVPGQVCGPEVEAEVTEPLKQVAGILATQLRFGSGPTQPQQKGPQRSNRN